MLKLQWAKWQASTNRRQKCNQPTLELEGAEQKFQPANGGATIRRPQSYPQCQSYSLSPWMVQACIVDATSHHRDVALVTLWWASS
jgi:hypothetical protein